MEKAGRGRQYAAFTLNGFDQDAGHVRTHFLAHARDVAKRHVRHSRQRAEAVFVFGLAGRGERAECAAVKRIVERDDPKTVGLALGEKIAARQLERGFDRLRAELQKNGAVHAGQASELGRELHVRLVVKVVGEVDELLGCSAIAEASRG